MCRTLSFVLILSIVCISSSSAQVLSQSSNRSYTTPHALIQSYLTILKNKQFDQLYAMTLYPNHQTVWKDLQSQKKEQLYKAVFDSVRRQMKKHQYAELESKFKQRLTAIPKDVEWMSFKPKAYNKCTQESDWECSTVLRFESATNKFNFFVSMYKVGSDYYLKSPKLYMSNELKKTSTMSQVEYGQIVYNKSACMGCHSIEKGVKKVGPSLFSIYQSTLTSNKGVQKIVDEAHLKSSLLKPHDFIVAGYTPSMPAYRLTDKKMRALIAYLKSL